MRRVVFLDRDGTINKGVECWLLYKQERKKLDKAIASVYN